MSRVCQVDFQLESMGKQALASHAKGKKHKSKIGSGASANTIGSFFSANSNILQTNMKGETLVYFRQAVYGVRNLDSPFDESVTKELLNSCRHARSRLYQNYILISSSNRRRLVRRKRKGKNLKKSCILQSKKTKVWENNTGIVKKADDLCQ